MNKNSSYEEVIQWLFNQLPMYQKVGVSAYKKDLINSLELDAYLGNPHQAYKTIHVAGTNGKGTTCHLLASVLQTAGYKVGLYTSPHLKDFRERIRINGDMISQEEVIGFVRDHKDYLESRQLSFFEMTVGMAFDIFKKRKIDIAVIETGLGGRLDSTNIITPILSIITSIDKDHTDLLGKTLKKIAIEKGGIIKDKVPVLINEHRPSLRSEFRKLAKVKNSPLYFLKNSNSEKTETTAKDVRVRNEQLTKKALEILKQHNFILISDKHIDSGFANVVKNTGLLGRYQIIQENPKVIADVAHNPAGISALFRKLNQESYESLHVVFGAVKGKAIEDVLNLLPKDAIYYLCEPDSPRKLDIDVLEQRFKTAGFNTRLSNSVSGALKIAESTASKKDLIVVTGSTFVVAEIL